MAASADGIAASSIFITCIPADPLDEDDDAAAFSDPVISIAVYPLVHTVEPLPYFHLQY
jgi:hypothetical protein